MHLALYQPDIAQNVGSLMRLSACFAVPLHIIEPCGFPFDMKKIRSVAMDYIDHVKLIRHTSWQAFQAWRAAELPASKLVLLTTRGSVRHDVYQFATDDILLCGRESAGVPEAVHAAADAAVRVPLSAKTRSLNIAQAATVVLAEALRQTNSFPRDLM